jgi:hypothetical protein
LYRFSLGLKQKFGTQVNIVDEDVKLKEFLGSVEEVNIRRKKIGLQSLGKYLQECKKLYIHH